MYNTQPTVQNELYTRLTQCAKTPAQWAAAVNTPMRGEICFEIHEDTESQTGLPYSYKMKIGDGASTYAQLPYFADIISLDGTVAAAAWDTGSSKLFFYKINQVNGQISLGNLFLTLAAGTKISLSMTEVSGRKDVTMNHASVTPTETTATLTDGGTFDVVTAVDSTGHATTITTYTLPSIATAISNAIANLDSSVATTANTKVLTGVTEADGLLTGFTETEILAGTNITITGGNGSITVTHSALNPAATDASSAITTDNSSTVGEKNMDIVTGFKVDAQGHVIHIDKDSSMNLIAADIKAPVKRQDDSTWNYRETGGDISIGEDIAKIPVLKGNTIVWNQLVKNGNFANGITDWNKSGGDYSISDGVFTLTTITPEIYYSNMIFQSGVTCVGGHKYYIGVDVNISKACKVRIQFPQSAETDVLSVNTWHRVGVTIVAETSASSEVLYIIPLTQEAGYTAGETLNFRNVICVDLTAMFGAGKEPTADEFEKLFPNSYYPYCEGRLVNLGGYGVKFNQEISYSESDWDGSMGIIEKLGDNTLKITANNGNYAEQACSVANIVNGHKYYTSVDIVEMTSNIIRFSASDSYSFIGPVSSIGKYSSVLPATFDAMFRVMTSGNGLYTKFKNLIFIDLTLMFGAGNEPSLEECEQIFTQDYYEYNAGTEMNIFDAIGDKKLGLESIGFNQWDEEWESGAYNGTTGEKDNNATWIRSKNKIKVDSSKTYYIKVPSTGGAYTYCFDSDKEYLGASTREWHGSSGIFTLPVGTAYITFACENTTSYAHDICINISDPSRNGTYEPYKKDTLDLSFIKDLGIPNFNIWDEEWVNGYWSENVFRPSYGQVCPKNFIPAEPNTTYFMKRSGQPGTVDAYDANKQFITSLAAWSTNDTEFTTPSNTAYIMFYYDGTTYNHDICINKSVPVINGIYLPHGETFFYFKYGLTSVGDITDEAYETYANKKMLLLDMGDLNWIAGGTSQSGVYKMACNLNGLIKPTSTSDVVANILTPKYDTISANSVYSLHTGISVDSSTICVYDANYNTDSSISAFRAAMKGVPLIIELETPVRVDYPEPHNFTYAVDDHGTEQQLPINVSSVINAPFRGTFEYMSNFKEAVLDLIDRVNSYANPVKGKNNTAQTEGKLAEYDSDHTVHSSAYAPSNATIVAGQDGNEYILPSVAALVAYVQTLISSALHYRGTVASWAALPSSGQQTGDLYIFSAVDTTHTPPIGIGDFAIWNGSSWDLIQGTVTVTNNAPTLVLNGQTYTIGTVEGVSLTLVTPDLQMSDPSANGNANDLQVITNVSQSNGQMSATKKYIPNASTSQKGVVLLERDIHYSESPDKVPSAGQTWREFSKRNVKAVPIAVVPVPAVYNTDLYASYELEASSSPQFTVNNSTFAQVYAASMGGYLFYVNNGVVYAAKMKATDWTKFDDDTAITSAIRAATETMIHVPTCNYKASGKKMKFGGLNPLYGGDYFKSPRWVGAYQMDNDGHSRPGVGSGHSKTMTEFWNLAQAIHTDFGLANYEFHNLINALYQAMFGNLNSEYVLSDGNSRNSGGWDSYRDLAHGAADALGDGAFVAAPHCVAATDGAGYTRYVTKFCGFEDLFGKLWEFRPGIRFYMDNGVRKAVVYDGNIVSNSAQGRIISGVLASAGGEYTTAMELGEHWDMLPKTVGGSSTTNYCDGYWAAASGELLLVGGSAGSGSRCGIACGDSFGGFGAAVDSIGARLAFYSEPIIVSGAEMVAMMA